MKRTLRKNWKEELLNVEVETLYEKLLEHCEGAVTYDGVVDYLFKDYSVVDVPRGGEEIVAFTLKHKPEATEGALYRYMRNFNKILATIIYEEYSATTTAHNSRV